MSLRVVRNFTNYDECYTPCDQVLPLLDYLDKDKTYYEATSGISSQIVDGFKKYKYNIMPSGEKDFFTCKSEDVYDGIITNPPYSTKDKFIEHCYSLKKPFALFLPVASFQGGRRGQMFMEHGMSCLVYNYRVDFTGGGSPPFGNAWFMWGFDTMPLNTIRWVNNPKYRSSSDVITTLSGSVEIKSERTEKRFGAGIDLTKFME